MTPVDIAKKYQWQDVSKFRIFILPIGADAITILGALDQTVLTAAITTIRLAELNNTPVEEWIAEEWRFASGKLEHYQVEMSFKDYKNLTLYKLWSDALQKFTRSYPNDQKYDIIVSTATDFDITSFETLLVFKDCILTSVSAPTLDNSANGTIAEFSVVSKSPYIKLANSGSSLLGALGSAISSSLNF